VKEMRDFERKNEDAFPDKRGRRTSVSKGAEDSQPLDECDYEFLVWNAWLYAGSDNLWAALIKVLHDAVDNRYGGEYKNGYKKAQTYTLLLSGMVALLVVALFLWQLTTLQYSSYLNILKILVTAVVGFLTSVRTVMVYLTQNMRPSDKVIDLINTEEFKGKMGFMAKIKEELVLVRSFASPPP
jgi:hypothetical protein